MFLKSIELTSMQPSISQTNNIRIRGKFSTSIEGLFPYLNTYLNDGIYNKEASTLTFVYNPKIINLQKDEVIVSKISSKVDAIETLEYIKYIINDCYDKKSEITPNCNSKNLISAVDIYEYLPKINCGKCGVTTCLEFADKLMKGQFNPNRCVHLYEVSNKDNKEEVENMVLALGYYL